jgi:hypothetical protein
LADEPSASLVEFWNQWLSISSSTVNEPENEKDLVLNACLATDTSLFSQWQHSP